MKVADYSKRILEDEGDVGKNFNEIILEISANTQIGQLNLRGNGLKGKHLSRLATVLTSHHKLSVLNLGANEEIDQEAILAIKKIISEHPTVKIILDTNRITDKQLICLVEGNPLSLQELIKNVHLDLSCNRITAEGFKIAKKFLSDYTTSSLLTGNPIDDAEFVEKNKNSALLNLEKINVPTALHGYSLSKKTNDEIEEKKQAEPSHPRGHFNIK